MSIPVAVITGCSSGVGLALAVQLGKTHHVYATMRNLEKQDKLNEAIKKAGVEKNVNIAQLDVISIESVQKCIDSIYEKENRIDVFVNNAGYSLFGTVEMLSIEDSQKLMDTNFMGVVRCQQAVLPIMRKQKGGKMITVTSIGGVWGQPFNDLYCASKFALEGLVESQCALFRSFGIYSSLVEPGAIKTDFVQNAVRPDMAKVPSAYHPALQSTIEAYQNFGNGQTSDEVAQVIIDQCVKPEKPKLRIQTNAANMPVFKAQLGDTTGEVGVKLVADRFLPKVDVPKRSSVFGKLRSKN